MFTALKNKIQEETGSDLSLSKVDTASTLTNVMSHPRSINLNNNNCNYNRRNRISSTVSINSNSIDDYYVQIEQNSKLRQQCHELSSQLTALQNKVDALEKVKSRLEKTNEILLESVKIAQTQKDIYCEEQESIQKEQQTEIEKLRKLLSFREQEAVDRLTNLQQSQNQIESLSVELDRLKPYEVKFENLKDEIERLRHSMQLDKNNLKVTLAATEEENRHIKMRLKIVEQVRLEALNVLEPNEKLDTLVREHKLLEQHLEEAHLQLSDIKGSWSGQNLALETQLSRLSKQVAEETTEKHKYQKMYNELTERLKDTKDDLIKANENIKELNDKIQLFEEEINKLNLALTECRNDSEKRMQYECTVNNELSNENNKLKNEIETMKGQFHKYILDTERRIKDLEQQLIELQNVLDQEKDEKLTALLKNAEISQREELLRKELRNERDEVNELHDQKIQLESELKQCRQSQEKLKTLLQKHEDKAKEFDDLTKDITEKNKIIKILNQRLTDLKKTVQREFCNARIVDNHSNVKTPFKLSQSSIYSNNEAIIDKTHVIMDDVNFKYLKHVIVKFLTSREVEAQHLIRAVATLLKMTKDEEKLLHDTLNWKMSWFGSRPNHGSGQNAVSIPPS